MSAAFAITRLSPEHDRAEFRSGVDELDRYFRQSVSQDVRRHFSRAFVAVERATGRVAGFTTLSATSIAVAEIPPDIVARLPRYPTIPAALLGRLAVDVAFRGRGLGLALLVDAFERAMASDVAVHALVVDAKDEGAAAFYRHFGFTRLNTDTRRHFMPLATARQLVR